MACIELLSSTSWFRVSLQVTKLPSQKYRTWLLIASFWAASFGIECGRLAKVPEDILSVALRKARHMEDEVKERIRRNRCVIRVMTAKPAC